jgi:putative transposase
MTSTTTVVSLRQPDEIDDPLTAVLRSGARRLLAQAIEAEADAFLALMKGERLPDGRERVVRHGHGPERQVQTGIGPVEVQRPKLRDRAVSEAAADRIRFTSAILPRWSRRTRSLDALLPILYLRGVSMGDFQEALGALLGRDAPNLSPSVIARLRGEWEADYTRWQRRDLSARRYVYVWADGVYLQARMEPQAECPTTKASRGHVGADRRDAGRQEGASRLPSGHAGKRPKLAGAAGRPQGAWPDYRP